MYLDIDGNMSTATDAEYCLVDFCVNDVLPQGLLFPYIVPATQECCMCIAYEYDGGFAVYADLGRINSLNKKTMASIGGAISGNLRSGISVDNHVDFYDLEVTGLPPAFSADEIISKIGEMPTSAITMDHHLFIRARELRAMARACTGKDVKARELMSLLISKADLLEIDNKVTLTTFYVYAMLAPDFANNLLIEIASRCDNPRDFNRDLKFEGVAAKQLQTIFRNDLSVVYELLVLRNRAYDEVDWNDERAHRERPLTVPLSYSTVFHRAKKIFSDAVAEGQRAFNMKWDTYWATRWSTLPGGSVVSQYEEDMLVKSSLPRDAKVKAAWFSALDRSEHDQWLARKPQIFASTSTKYEWGKVRALYGADVTSFLHADYGMHMCEDTLPSYFPVGKRANDKYIRGVIEKFATGVPFCFDYDDFNSQHSTSSMRAVIDAWLETYKPQLTAEQIESVKWTSESLDDVIVRYNDIREVRKVCGTLLSGWRLTSFVNTVLNRVYLMEAGIESRSIYALHNGDDMYASMPTLSDAMNVVKRAATIGIRAQVSKTNLGTIGEFLRVDTRAKDQTGRQYLARAAATAVHGRVETGPPNDFRSLLTAFVARADALKERGGNKAVADALLQAQDAFACELFKMSSDVVHALRHYHPVQGGGDETARARTTRLEQVKEQNEFESEFSLIQRGVNEYTDYIVRKFKIPRSKVNYQRVFERAVDSLTRSRVSYRIVTEEDALVGHYIGQFKAFHNSGWVANISKARTMGFIAARQLYGLQGAVIDKIRNARDPIRYMAAIL